VGIDVEPLRPADLPETGEFLHRNLNERVPADAWSAALDVPWATPQPNHGFVLRAEGAVAGVLLAFYSDREIPGRVERFCNLGAWCVLPDHRLHSLRLLRAALGQDGYTFTDLSPSGAVVPLNTRLGFTTLDTTTMLVPCIPYPPLGRTRLSASTATFRERLTRSERRVLDDHAGAPAVHAVLLEHPDGHCLVLYRRDRRRGLPLFASVLYASNPALFATVAPRLAGHVAVRHRVAALLVERRVADPPALAVQLRRARPKMFRSNTVAADQIDNLYSELCCVEW